MKNSQNGQEELKNAHPLIPEAVEQLKQGRISRREFLRTASLLGMSASVATLVAACGGGGVATEEEPVAEAPADEEMADDAPATAAGGIKRGGTLRVATDIAAVDHPARFSWIFDSNQFRHVFEYLTETDADNVTHPYLLESWEANDELTVWTLNLRQGVMWTNGDEFVAEHVIYNFGEWLNPDTGSSILGLWTGFLTLDGIEVVDDYTIRLNLDAPLLAVPEQLFHYPAQIMHPSFDGDITSGNNPSTGPMQLDEFVVGERARVIRRTEGEYWQMGEDGDPLPYLDAIEWVNLGDDQTPAVAAIQSGQVDTIYDPNVDTFLALRNNDAITIDSVGTADTRVLRFRVDQEPWSNPDVIRAVRMLQDRQKILDTAYFGEGDVGYDTHIAPVHPAWSPMDLPEYDPEGAMALLAETGQEGLTFSVSVGTGWPDIVSYMETLQEDARAAGVNIELDTMPNSAFWDLWTETAVGVTPWAHRPVAVMLLPLAYIADEAGDPVAWNETRWVDDEFSTILKEAQGTLDVEARRELYAQLQRIQVERGPIGISYFRNKWLVYNPAFQGFRAHPTNYNLWREVWYDPDLDTLNS